MMYGIGLRLRGMRSALVLRKWREVTGWDMAWTGRLYVGTLTKFQYLYFVSSGSHFLSVILKLYA
jgi:hypothetical protein